MAHARGRVDPPPPCRPPKRPPRPVGLIAGAVLLGVPAIIGLAFLGTGLEFNGHVIRTTATVVAVHEHPDSSPAKGKDGTTFTLRFTDQGHQLVTEDTEQVMQEQPVTPGDRIQVYVPADPSDVTDVRFGAPGSYDFFMAAMFLGIAVVGWTGIAIAWVRRKRRIARLVAGLVGTG